MSSEFHHPFHVSEENKAQRIETFLLLRKIIDLNEAGFAVRYYNIGTDDFSWLYCLQHYEVKESHPWVFMNDSVVCPGRWLEKNVKRIDR